MNDQSHQPTPPPPGETPRTDAALRRSVVDGIWLDWIHPDDAKKLERELAEARVELAGVKLACRTDLAAADAQLAAAQERIKELEGENESLGSWKKKLMEVGGELHAAQAAVAELCGVLKTHGRHLGKCHSLTPFPYSDKARAKWDAIGCDCGLEAALAKHAPEKKP